MARKRKLDTNIGDSVLADEAPTKKQRSETPVQDPTPAATAVFSTTELLENILLKIDARTLLHSKRVCVKWSDLIDKSVWLQKKLFYKEATSLKEALYLADGEDRPDTSLLVRDADGHKMEDGYTLLNPLIFENSVRAGSWWNADFTILERHVESTSSCHNMLLANPPKLIDLDITRGKRASYGDFACVRETLGHLLEGVARNWSAKHSGRKPRGGFRWAGETLTVYGILTSISGYLADMRKGFSWDCENDSDEDSDDD